MADGNFTVLVQAGPLESYDVHSVRIERKLGQVAEAEVEVHGGEAIGPDDLLGCEARVAFGRGELEHAFAGVVTDVSFVATPDDQDGRGTVHRLRIRSHLGLLADEVDCRILQDKDVKEIVSELLASLGIDAKHQSWGILGTYPKLEYTVQYNESALAFVSRLLEKEGIYFYSMAGDDGEILVFEDDSKASEPIAGDSVLPFRHGSGLSRSEDAVATIV